MPEPTPLEVHKALADDTRYRLYRYLRLSGRPMFDDPTELLRGLRVPIELAQSGA